MNLFKFVCCLFLGSYVEMLQAQNIAPPSLMEVYLIAAPNDSTNNWGDTAFAQNASTYAKMFCTVTDTSNILKMHLSLGSTLDGNELMEKTFLFNNQGTFTDGTSYIRNGFNLEIVLGIFLGLNRFYANIVLEDNAGHFSDVLTYDNH